MNFNERGYLANTSENAMAIADLLESDLHRT